MSQYISVLIWIALCAVVIKLLYAYRPEILCGTNVYRIEKIWAIIVAIPLIYWAAVRPGGVFDTGAYANTFCGMANSISEISEYMIRVDKDKGFYFFANLIHVYFGSNTVAYFGIIAVVQGVFLFRMMRKYSTDYVLSVFIFVASTDYLSWMHNGIRQFLAVTIILGGSDFIMEKKYIRAIMCIAFASLFHGSALLMIPVVFIVQGKPWNIRTVIMIGMCVLAILYIDRFTVLLDDMLSDTQYTNVVSDWQSWNDDGTNPLRVLVYSIPMILSVVGWRYIVEEDNPLINKLVNLSIATSVIYVVSMFTSGIFIGRLPIYTSIYATCVLLPWEIEHFFTEDSAKLVKVGVIISYLGFYYYQCHIAWGIF